MSFCEFDKVCTICGCSCADECEFQVETCEYDDFGDAYSLTDNGGALMWDCRKCFFFFFDTHTHSFVNLTVMCCVCNTDQNKQTKKNMNSSVLL